MPAHESRSRGEQQAPFDALGALRPLGHKRRADEVVEQIRDLILQDELSIGDRLPSERALAERLDSSRATVSQALRTLSIMGLIEIRPGAGAFVTRNPAAMVNSSVELLVRSQPGDPLDVAQLRYWLETVGALQAMRRLDDAARERLAESLAAMRRAEGQVSRWIVADSRFHSALVQASGNAYLGTLYDSVHAATIANTYGHWISGAEAPPWFSEDFEAQMALHEDLLHALTERSHTGLLAALERHQVALLSHLGLDAAASDLDAWPSPLET